VPLRFPIVTRYPDYDSKGHVNNAVYLTYFESARHDVWTTAFGADPDFPFILAEATVKYVSEATIGEPLEIEVATDEVRSKAWVWRYEIRTTDTQRVVAQGRTVQVMFDYAAKRTIPIPDEVRAKLSAM
jgi:acyl-CoA thioester hydrolase